MSHPILFPTAPENVAPAVAPQPYPPDWLNALTEEERQSPEMQEFGRRMLDRGAEHVTWLVWRFRSKLVQTPPLPRQGSVFFLDCGRGPFAVTAGHVFEQFVEDLSRRNMWSCQIGNVGFNPEER